MLGLCCLLTWPTGCSQSGAKPDSSPTSSEAPAPGIYRVGDSTRIDESELFERLARARWVVVGERHTSDWHHELQLRIFEHLVDNREGDVALGMEMFQRRHQEALDGYVAGELSESEMLDRVEWKRTWGMDPALYRGLWKRAARDGQPLVGLNVDREVVRRVAREGLAGIPEGMRGRLPDEIDTSNERQRAFLEHAFKGHGESSEKMNFEYFVEAQASWDEFMAHRAVAYLDDHADLDAMVVVCGRGHARNFGIPSRIARRSGSREDVVSLVPFDRSKSKHHGPRSLTELREDDVADYVWIR